MTRPAHLLVLLLFELAAGAALAQTAAPSTEAMIEQLKQPRTRSLRNLVPEAAPVAAPAEAAAGTTATVATPGAAPAESGTSGSAASSPAGTATASAPATATTAVAATPSAVAAEPPRPSLSLQIQFDFDSARVRPESRQALANLSQALLSPELRDSRFAVEGHTDAKGSADYNLRLSSQRALAVRDVLKSLGVDEARLQASGKGASDLENAADPFAAQNRRVRIVNLE